MGFEQLAALRDQLAAERAAREGHDKRAPSKTAKDEGNKHEGKKPRGPKPAQAGQDKRSASGKPQRVPGEGRKPQGQSQGRPASQAKAQPETPRDPLLVAIGRLQHAFPKAFPKKPAPRVALKLGIVEDLYAHAAKLRLSEDEIKAAIATWCSVGRYWAALTKDAVRFDLNGEPSGTVTAAEAGHASFLARQQRKKAQAAAKAAEPAAGSPAAGSPAAAAPAEEPAAVAQEAVPAPADTPAEEAPAVVNAPGDDTASV
jgi:ProP effector